MGLTDYISRNPHGAAKPISMYDEDFVIAQIDAIVKTINAIRQRGRPRKFPILYRTTIPRHQTQRLQLNVKEAGREKHPWNRGTIPKSKCLEHKVIRQKQK